MSLLKALKDEESSTKLKLRNACISSTNAENNKRRSLDRCARQEELRCIVMQYKDLPIDVYMQTLVGYYNYDVLENWIYWMYECMYVCINVCMYVCIYLSIYVSIYQCKYQCMYVCINLSMYVCMYVCMNE